MLLTTLNNKKDIYKTFDIELVLVIEVERAQFYRARAELELSTSSPDEPELFKY